MQNHGRTALAAIVLVIALSVAAGCLAIPGTTEQGSSPTVAATDRLTTTKEMWTDSAGNAPGSAGNGPAPAPTQAAYSSGTNSGTDQKIIRTADVTIEVKDVPGAMDALKSLATKGGGYLSSSRLNRDSSDRAYASVVMRVPAAAFDQTMTDLKSVGTITSVSTRGEDVTEEYVDLNARKTAFQNQLDQYNKILAKATTVEDILKVQVEIERVQVELNRLEGRLKYLNNRIDLSIITVSLHEPAPIGGGITHDFNSVINEGINAFLGMIDALIIFVFIVLPLVIIGGIGYGVYRWHKGRRPAPAAAPPEVTEKK